MALLTPGVTINSGDLVTRQTIYDLVRLASIGTVQQSDLDATVLTIVSQSLPPTPSPGLLWWNQTLQLAMVYTDMIDNTGCSVWCAFGPDRIDTILYAEEPIPFGAAVVAGQAGRPRSVRLPPNPSEHVATGITEGRFYNLRVIGLNQRTNHGQGGEATAPTTPSGAWFNCAVLGFAKAWTPVFTPQMTPGLIAAGQLSVVGYISGSTGLTGQSGATDVRGGVMSDGQGTADMSGAAINRSFFGRGLHNVNNVPGVLSPWGLVLLTGPRWR